jgi:hypothetical protein
VHGNDVEIITRPVIGERDVERAIGFDQAHHQALRIRLSSGLLLEYLAFVDHPQGLRPGNASLAGAHQGMVAPEDALCVRRSADCGKVESHESKDIEVA